MVSMWSVERLVCGQYVVGNVVGNIVSNLVIEVSMWLVLYVVG